MFKVKRNKKIRVSQKRKTSNPIFSKLGKNLMKENLRGQTCMIFASGDHSQSEFNKVGNPLVANRNILEVVRMLSLLRNIPHVG